MKYFFATLICSILLAPTAFGQGIQTQATTSGTTPSTIFDTTTELSLEARKETTAKNLQSLSTWLSTMLLRVQLATTRLSTNGIDTTEASGAIALTQDALTVAKTELALFMATPVTTKPETLATLRVHAKNTEEALKKAKTHLTESLTLLQVALQTQ